MKTTSRALSFNTYKPSWEIVVNKQKLVNKRRETKKKKKERRTKISEKVERKRQDSVLIHVILLSCFSAPVVFWIGL